VKILHLLGQEGPKTSIPSRYIRYIYNRISLESASVRAAAVSALSKFGAQLDTLRPSIIALLRRCTFDSDDEVRDRATFNLFLLEKSDKSLPSTFILGDFNVNLANLERALLDYQKNPTTAPFDVQRVPTLPIKMETIAPKKESNKNPSSVPIKDVTTQAVASLPQFASYGKLWRSSFPVELTEKETEYVVNCVKVKCHVSENDCFF
jgi:coatomer protein complex subunit gamma